ncbi:unnamed protein product [Camellia sinensis]
MESRLSIWALGLLFFTLVVADGNNSNSTSNGSRNCKFPAIFNFGDSHSDTGSSSATFNFLQAPNGMSFRNYSKRSSDGRLIIDYIAQNLGLPYLDAPVDSIGTNFKHGANFATGGARISSDVIMGKTTPYHLGVQVSQFLQFKSRAIALHKELLNNKNNPPIENKFPEPEVFSKALYTIDIGGNDDFNNLTISTTMDQFTNTLQRLLGDGAKYFWIHNTGPNGCGPFGHINCKKEPGCVLDQNGCDKKWDENSQAYNKLLKDRVSRLRAQYPDAVITYVDIYSAKHKLIVNAKKYGFGDPFKFCCGNGYLCGQVDFNETLLGTACKDPQNYINWDGIHYTQAANRFVANFVVNGSLSDPPVPVAEACHKHY